MYGVILNSHCTKTATNKHTNKKKTDKKKTVITVAQRYCKDCVKRKTGACPKRSRPPLTPWQNKCTHIQFPATSGWSVVSCSAEMSHILLLLLLTFETAASEGECQTSRGVGSLPNAVTHDF